MSKQNLIREPIFICGCHRTGTTLLQKILSRHSQLDILPETKLYAWQWHPFHCVSSTDTQGKLGEIIKLMPFVNRAWGLGENRERMAGLQNSLAPPKGFSGVGDIMAHLLSHATKPGSRVGEKSPLHIYHVDDILKKFPDAKILITKRDLRGAFYSQSMRSRRKKLSYRSFKLFNFVASWTTAMRLAKRYLNQYGSDRIQVVEFESLVQSPDETLKSVCEFLGVEFEPAMKDVQFENSSFEDVQNKAGVDSKSADRWQSNMPDEVKSRLEYLGCEDLKQGSYVPVKAAPSIADRLTKLAINTVNSIATRKPQLVCYLGRDSRYKKLHRQYLEGKFDEPFGPKLFVLGNYKSGTTAIVKLLASLCGMSSTIDFPRRIRNDEYALVRGELTFEDIVNNHPALFCRQIVKIPALTFIASDIAARFPDAKIVFVVRDPRDNIRSILNSQKIPGNKQSLPAFRHWLMKLQNKPSMDANIWGQSDDGYVGILAQRWNQAIEHLQEMNNQPILIRYENFRQQKHATLNSLADQLGFQSTQDIKHLLEKQFQSAGNQSISWQEFFGAKNIATIERICGDLMNQFDYEF